MQVLHECEANNYLQFLAEIVCQLGMKRRSQMPYLVVYF